MMVVARYEGGTVFVHGFIGGIHFCCDSLRNC